MEDSLPEVLTKKHTNFITLSKQVSDENTYLQCNSAWKELEGLLFNAYQDKKISINTYLKINNECYDRITEACYRLQYAS